MTKQEIINKSLTEIDKLKNDNKIDTSEIDFYNDFAFRYSPFSYEKFCEMSGTDFLIAVVNAMFSDIPFKKVYEDINKLRPLFDSDNVDEINMLHTLLVAISEKGIDDEIIEGLKDENKHRSVIFIKKLTSKHSESDVVMDYLSKFVNDDKSIILPLVEYNKRHHIFTCNMLLFCMESKLIKKTIEMLQDELNDAKDKMGVKVPERYFNKTLNKGINKVIKDKFHIDQEKDCFMQISEYQKFITDKMKNSEKNKKKDIKAYEELICNLNKMFTSSEVTNYDSIVKNIPNDEIRLETLKLIYQHNKLEYENINSTYNELFKNSTVHFLVLFKKYNISKDEIDLNKVMKNDYDTVEELLKLITYFTDDKMTIIAALQTTNIVTCKYLKELKNRGILNSNTFIKYPSVFDSNSTEFKNLDNNIKIVSNYKINPAIFINNPEVLLKTDIGVNLKVLGDYDLLKYIRNNNDYRYLTKSGLDKLIDKILELGFESYLKEDLSLLNEDNWDRIYVLKAIKYEITDKSELLYYLRNSTFIIPDKNISNYIPDAVSYYKFDDCDESEVSYDDYLDGRVYNIGGVLISKNRFIRNSLNNKSDSTLKKLLDGGLYSSEEIELVKNSIYNTQEK